MGVGLFRTEFLFMNHKNQLPEEEEQFEAYRRAIELMNGLPVTIRTIDVGADKPLESMSGGDGYETAPNPALGSAGDPLEPVRAADVHDAIARDPAGVGVRPGEDPDSDARARAGNRPDARPDSAKRSASSTTQASPTIRTCRSAR